jgi:hypothetical protein
MTSLIKQQAINGKASQRQPAADAEARLDPFDMCFGALLHPALRGVEARPQLR